MNETVAQALLDYLNEDGPQVTWPEYEFEDVCYSRWAAVELVNALLDHPLDSPDLTIRNFADKMSRFSCVKEDTVAERIFLTAAEFAYMCLETLCNYVY